MKQRNYSVFMQTDAQIAQLVEQRTENPRVAGSIPALGTQHLSFMGGCFFCFLYYCKISFIVKQSEVWYYNYVSTFKSIFE